MVEFLHVNLKCTVCGQESQQSLGWLHEYHSFTCPAGHHNSLEREEFRRIAQAIKEFFADRERDMPNRRGKRPKPFN